MGDISKIDDSTIGIVQPITIFTIKDRIAQRLKVIADYQSGIDAHNEQISKLKALNDQDIVTLATAASLQVGDALS